MTKARFIEKLGAELGIPSARLGDAAPLSSFPSWDSMGRMAVVAMYDTELGIDLPQGEINRCQTVGDLVALAAAKLDS